MFFITLFLLNPLIKLVLKRLRIHNIHEYHDYYTPEASDLLKNHHTLIKPVSNYVSIILAGRKPILSNVICPYNAG